jgi:hypothetical protein
MSANGQSDRVSRLQRLADSLEHAQAAAGDLVSERVTPVDEAIRRIGVTGPDYWHRGEWLAHCHATGRALGQVLAELPEGTPADHPFAFAQETTADGARLEYALCAARGRDRRCGLYVSVCSWRETSIPGLPGAVVQGRKLVRPDEIPLPVRVNILNVLDEFTDVYERHVRTDRRGLLSSDDAAGAEPFDAPPPAPPFAHPAPEADRATGTGIRGQLSDAEAEELKRQIKASMPDPEELKRRIQESMPDPEELKRQIQESIPDPEELKRQIQESLPDFEEMGRQIRESLPDLEELKQRVREEEHRKEAAASAGESAPEPDAAEPDAQ